MRSKKEVIILCLILMVSVIFRLLFLDKPSGLWYDEIVSFKQASQNNILSVIVYTLKTDIHMPAYQVFLHIWSRIFSFSDLALRGFSALCGIITVIIAYFTGKELKDTKTAIFCSAFFAINSFFILYSQEVRMYAFLIMLATLNMYFLIKAKNQPENKINYTGFWLTALLIIYTYTICFIYVLAETFTLAFCLFKNKVDFKLFNRTLMLFVLLCLPFILYLFFNYSKYTTEINGYYCDWSSLFIVLQNIFTPMLEGLGNNPVHYIGALVSNFTPIKFIFIIVPISIGLTGIVNALIKDKNSLILIFASLVFILAEIIAFKYTNFKILTRYLSVSVPALIIVSAYGLRLFNTKISYILTTLFIIINLSYLIFAPDAAYKLQRDGYKPLVNLVNSTNPSSSDFVVVWNRKEVLDKYLNTKDVNILSILKDFAYRSEIMLQNENTLKNYPIEKRKEFLKSYFTEDKMPYNTFLLMNFIAGKMNEGQKFIITTTENFDQFDKNSYKKYVQDNYNDISLNDLLTIKSLTDIKVICDKNFKFIEKKNANGYVVIVYER